MCYVDKFICSCCALPVILPGVDTPNLSPFGLRYYSSRRATLDALRTSRWHRQQKSRCVCSLVYIDNSPQYCVSVGERDSCFMTAPLCTARGNIETVGAYVRARFNCGGISLQFPAAWLPGLLSTKFVGVSLRNPANTFQNTWRGALKFVEDIRGPT